MLQIYEYMRPGLGKTILFGCALWLGCFLGAMFIFPLHDKDRILFETLMTLIFVTSSMICGITYFRQVFGGFFRAGVRAGLLWMSVNLLVDLVLFSYGPLARPFPDYVKDIGLVYLVLPIMMGGIGSILQRKTT